MKRSRTCSCRASTLLLALWALLLLSGVIFLWAKWIDQGIAVAGEANLGSEARALAHSGVTVALHPLVTRRSPILKATFEGNRGYEVTIKSEGGKLNINFLLAGEDPERLAILKNYLALRGLTLEEREILVDCLLDWIDGDNIRRLNGAEEDTDYKPTNRPFTSIEEIQLVKGSAPLMAYKNWRDDLTVTSNGPLDVDAAPAELLALIPEIGDLRAEQFVKLRQGDDGEDGTLDDVVFGSGNEVMERLGLTPQQISQMSGYISFRDPTVRIRSIGIAGNVHRQVDVIARKVEGNSPRILLWTEK